MDKSISNHMTIASKLVSFFESSGRPTKVPSYKRLGVSVANSLYKALTDGSLKTDEDLIKFDNNTRSRLAKAHTLIVGNRKGSGDPSGYQERFSQGFFDRAKDLGLVKFANGLPVPAKPSNLIISNLIRDIFYKPSEVLDGKSHGEIYNPDISGLQKWDDSEHGKDPKQPVKPDKSFRLFDNPAADRKSQPDIPIGKNANLVYGDDKFKNLKKQSIDPDIAASKDPTLIPIEPTNFKEPEDNSNKYDKRISPDRDALDDKAEKIRLSKMTPDEIEAERSKVATKNRFQRTAYKIASALASKYPEASTAIYFWVNRSVPQNEAELKYLTNSMVWEVFKTGVPEKEVFEFVLPLIKEGGSETVAEYILAVLDSL